MMLARVADSLYWIGRYAERAEHYSRLASVMLNAALDRSDSAEEASRIALAALGREEADATAFLTARGMTLDREDTESVVTCVANARENARQVRDQITTETWERLNLLYLRVTAPSASDAFADSPLGFLQEAIADLHLFKGASDATMSHGEGWRFMLAGVYLERAQLMARLLQVGFGGTRRQETDDHLALVNVLRMGCALEPYLRVYTADIRSRYILEFLLFDQEFPRSVRFSTARIEDHLNYLAKGQETARGHPVLIAGRLNARLTYADAEAVESQGAGALLAAVEAECGAIHQAIYDTYVAYPLETRLPT